jgi:hypothetical protein
MKARRLAAAAGVGLSAGLTAEVVGLRAFSRLMAAAELTAATTAAMVLDRRADGLRCPVAVGDLFSTGAEPHRTGRNPQR